MHVQVTYHMFPSGRADVYRADFFISFLAEYKLSGYSTSVHKLVDEHDMSNWIHLTRVCV
jgi:hypothetical protein